jgi:glyoxylase-like metal-dependent hydrolase (beta-lactamase superfamily II)
MTLIYSGDTWTIQSFVSGFENNAYLVTCLQTGSSMIIDTPDSPHELIDAASRTDVRAVLITHNHMDHLQGFGDVVRKFDVPVGIGNGDAHSVDKRAGRLLDVSQDTLITYGGISMRAVSTPGHTPGSTCFVLPSESPGATPHVFTGDTLFPGGPGKSRSAETFDQIVESIGERLMTLPADTVVLPGHGRSTTIAESKAEYDSFIAMPRKLGLYGDVTWSGAGA